jgi:hypothetical protein
MKQTFTVHLSPDFYILCDFFSLTPEEVLQFYINHISLSVFADKCPEEPLSTATYFFGKYSVPKVTGEPL